jgi:tagatose-1,6-bisphosphate aldolase non-catalytic subunit AgaZ/GatZ
MSNTKDTAVDEAAILILKEHRHEHLAMMNRYKTHSVYVIGTHCPPPDASDAVLAVEETLMHSAIATARFHEREVARFDEAIARAEAGQA